MCNTHIGARIKSLRLRSGLNQIAFAAALGVTHGFVSGLENGKYQPTTKLVAVIVEKFQADANWLVMGKVREAEEPESREIAELLDMTKTILKSGTDFAESLAANIRSFHKSVGMEKKLAKMDCDCAPKRAAFKKGG